jgi:hypothetical protein
MWGLQPVKMSPRIITTARILFIALSPLVAVAASADASAPLLYQYNDRLADYQGKQQGTEHGRSLKLSGG